MKAFVSVKHCPAGVGNKFTLLSARWPAGLRVLTAAAVALACQVTFAADDAARVSKALHDGLGAMPSVKASLTEAEIDALAHYVSRASGEAN